MGTKGIIIFKRIFTASDDNKIKVKKISLLKYKFKWNYWKLEQNYLISLHNFDKII